MKTISLILLAFSGGLLIAPSACSDVQCDDKLTRPDPTDPSKEVKLVLGEDGLCHWPWYDDETWGQSCAENDDCSQDLICLAPDLPICTQINCNPDPSEDEVCAAGFMCLDPGKGNPTVCIPLPPSGSGGSSAVGGNSGSPGGEGGVGPEGGMGGVASSAGGQASAPVANIGTACTASDDAVCVGGTVCESTQLQYCTVMGCAETGPAKTACDAAAADGFTCMAGAPFPEMGICYKP
jgi:hypothetical protein